MLTPKMLHTRYGRTFITFDQDEISGSYLLTFKNKETDGIHPNERHGWGFDGDGHPILSKHRALNLLSRAFVREEDGSLSYSVNLPKPIASGRFKGCYRGRDIISMFIPEGINARFKAKDKTTDVIIENGKVVKGVLDDQFFGTKSGFSLLLSCIGSGGMRDISGTDDEHPFPRRVRGTHRVRLFPRHLRHLVQGPARIL